MLHAKFYSAPLAIWILRERRRSPWLSSERRLRPPGSLHAHLASRSAAKSSFTSLSQSLAGIATRLNGMVAQYATSKSPLPVRLAILEVRLRQGSIMKSRPLIDPIILVESSLRLLSQTAHTLV